MKRIDRDGRDVTTTPGLWDETDIVIIEAAEFEKMAERLAQHDVDRDCADCPWKLISGKTGK